MTTVEEIGNNAYKFVVDNVRHPVFNVSKLESLLHTFNEAGIWSDMVDTVSLDQAILCWRVIERIRRHHGQLPNNCRL